MNPKFRVLETSRDYLLPCGETKHECQAASFLHGLTLKTRRLAVPTAQDSHFDSLAFRTLVECEFDDD